MQAPNIETSLNSDVLTGGAAGAIIKGDEVPAQVIGDLNVTGKLTYSGTANAAASSIVIAQNMSSGDTSKPIAVTATPTSLSQGARQGAINIVVDRPAADALTSWDGNPDCGLKIQAVNRAVSGANGATRGIDVSARNRDAGTESWINSIYASTVNSANTIASAYTAQFITDNGGTISTKQTCLTLQDISQGSSPADTSLLELTTGTINPATGARAAMIHANTADTAGFTNFIAFNSTAGLEGATYAGGSLSGTIVGKIQVKIGSNIVYLPVYTSLT